MSTVRVSVTLPGEVRERLANEAKARGQSLDSFLRAMLVSGRPSTTADEWSDLLDARSEARARARELGQARREIRELRIRLNALLAGRDEDVLTTPPWSLGPARRTRSEVEAWWRWLAAGVETLRERYGLVSQLFDGPGQERTRRYWWESAGRVRAIAIAVRWEEMLDDGGAVVPSDPRFAEAFMDYLWRIAHREPSVAPVGQFWDSWDDDSLERWRLAERAAFDDFTARQLHASPVELPGNARLDVGVRPGSDSDGPTYRPDLSADDC